MDDSLWDELGSGETLCSTEFNHLHGCDDGPANRPHAVPGLFAFGWLCSCMVHCLSPSGPGPGQWLAPSSLQHIYRSSYPPSIPRHRHSFFSSASKLSFFPRDLRSFICLNQALPGSCSLSVPTPSVATLCEHIQSFL